MSDATAVERIMAVLAPHLPCAVKQEDGQENYVSCTCGWRPATPWMTYDNFAEHVARALLASGVVVSPAEAVAAFLRDALAEWNRACGGEYNGTPPWDWCEAFAQRWPGVGSEKI